VTILRLGGWLLAIGGVIALVGAFTPPFKQWYAPPDEALRIIAAYPLNWRIINGGFLLGTVIAALGFLVVAFACRGRASEAWASAAAAAFCAGAVFWVLVLLFRLTDYAAAAKVFVATGAVPGNFEALQHAASRHFALFAILAFGGLGTLGGGMLADTLASRWLSWTMVAVGLVGIPVVTFIGPWILYVPLVLLGFSLA